MERQEHGENNQITFIKTLPPIRPIVAAKLQNTPTAIIIGEEKSKGVILADELTFCSSLPASVNVCVSKFWVFICICVSWQNDES